MIQNLFQRINDLVPTLSGWGTPEKASMFAAAVLTLRPETTVEIGVFGGRTLLPMCLAHKESGRGHVYGIDPWNASASKAGQLCPADAEFWATCDHEAVYQKFLSVAKQIGVMDVLKVIRKRSDEVEPPPSIDLLHVDGNHGEQALTDTQRFACKVRLGGSCFLDDLDWTGGGVRRAETWLLSNGFRMLFPMESGAMYQRIV